MSTQTKPNGLKLKFLTSLQNDKENSPLPLILYWELTIYIKAPILILCLEW